MSDRVCSRSDLHPYACSHDEGCEHCARRPGPDHDPGRCVLCADDGGRLDREAAEPYLRSLRDAGLIGERDG